MRTNDKEKTSTDVGASAEAAEKVLAGTSSTFECTIDSADRQGKSHGMVGLLAVGAGNAVSAREIAEIIGCKPRDVSRDFEQTRNGGVAICAGRYGYFLPSDASELLSYIKAFDRRLRAIQRTRRSLEAAYCRMTGQTTMWGDNT